MQGSSYRETNIAIARFLGVDPKTCRRLTLDVDAQEPPTLTITRTLRSVGDAFVEPAPTRYRVTLTALDPEPAVPAPPEPDPMQGIRLQIDAAAARASAKLRRDHEDAVERLCKPPPRRQFRDAADAAERMTDEERKRTRREFRDMLKGKRDAADIAEGLRRFAARCLRVSCEVHSPAVGVYTLSTKRRINAEQRAHIRKAWEALNPPPGKLIVLEDGMRLNRLGEDGLPVLRDEVKSDADQA